MFKVNCFICTSRQNRWTDAHSRLTTVPTAPRGSAASHYEQRAQLSQRTNLHHSRLQTALATRPKNQEETCLEAGLTPELGGHPIITLSAVPNWLGGKPPVPFVHTRLKLKPIFSLPLTWLIVCRWVEEEGQRVSIQNNMRIHEMPNNKRGKVHFRTPDKNMKGDH